MQCNSEQFKKILMAIGEEEIKQKLKEFMLENNIGYLRILAMINVHKDIKIDLYTEQEEDEPDSFDFSLN